jgi:hypothetical protein
MYGWMHERRRGQGEATCSTILWRRTWLRSSTLMAQTWAVRESRASLTLAKVPSPMVFPSSYGPTRVFLAAASAMPAGGVWMGEAKAGAGWSLVRGPGLCFSLTYHSVVFFPNPPTVCPSPRHHPPSPATFYTSKLYPRRR